MIKTIMLHIYCTVNDMKVNHGRYSFEEQYKWKMGFTYKFTNVNCVTRYLLQTNKQIKGTVFVI